jgi:hypothetical protein
MSAQSRWSLRGWRSINPSPLRGIPRA